MAPVLWFALVLAAAPAAPPAATASSPAVAAAAKASPAPASAAPPAGTSAPLAALVNKAVEAYGGRAALERFRACIEEGEVSSLMLGRGIGKLRRVWEAPRKLRVSIAYAGSPEVRILDGARGWRAGREVSGPPYCAMVLQAARLGLPLSLIEGLASLKDKGAAQVDGRAVRAVELPLGDGMSVTAEIDPGSGRILRATGRLDGAGPPLQFTAVYSDFRTVQGVLVPFHEANFAKGNQTGETALSRVELLPKAPAGSFAPE
jgi:hypothetical protein